MLCRPISNHIPTSANEVEYSVLDSLIYTYIHDHSCMHRHASIASIASIASMASIASIASMASIHPSILTCLPAYLPTCLTYLLTYVHRYVRTCMHACISHRHTCTSYYDSVIYIYLLTYTYIAGIILYTYSIFYIDILLRHPFFWQEIPVPEPVPDPVEDMCRSSRSQRPFSCSIDENTNGKWHLYSLTLWLFHIAMENGPFIDGSPMKIGDFPWLC